jgi:large subunit ribosomal protein L1
MARGRKYTESAKRVEPGKAYPVGEAVALAQKISTAKFDASIEAHVKLGIDTTKASQSVRTTVTFPHATGKSVRVAAFVPPALESEAAQAGADPVGGDDLVAKVKAEGRLEADVAVATPDMMKKLGPVAKILGQKGLMPNPKDETVTAQPGKTIQALKAGKATFRSDATGNVHVVVGTVSGKPEDIAANLHAFLDALKRARPAEAKGTFIKSVHLSPSMGPSVRVAV